MIIAGFDEKEKIPPAVTPEQLGLGFRVDQVIEVVQQTNRLLLARRMPSEFSDIDLEHLNRQEIEFYTQRYRDAGWTIEMRRSDKHIWPVFSYGGKE
ncbi:MAG: hypothetical protein UY48_C0005G0004 [Candidatus Gottesmanbacteria bacterium GW2011_GWB1_49_7]|uniref:Uncharacterized protein n=1 Tax=Candidatus Gottesmanbacteria bacterium GW2011_GWB1_49_7 TaxID=1618448 RepID=A0A0G1W2U7_9BACT|nr:MAG: hypothetical protein UY48_C0005G0004 [Candidatus Gottesmanbacteria bacterium GW2011_GWB1_49_7]